MNFFYQSNLSTMPIRLKMRKMPLTIIRPLALIPERLIAQFASDQQFKPLKKACPYDTASHRNSTSLLFQQLEKDNPEVRFSIWSTLEKNGLLMEE